MERFLALTAKTPVLFLISISALLAIVSEFIAKRWSLQPSISQFVLAVCLYAGAGAIFIPCLLREKLIVVGLLYDILTNTGFLMLGYFVFHERFTRLQTVGAFFGLLSIFIFIAAEVLEK